MKGKFIVIEGSDGAGKATQLNLLKNYLEEQKQPVKVIDFPRYYDSFFGRFIGRVLAGEFGSINHINPYIMSILFACDRGQSAGLIKEWLEEGVTVLSNRYATSNLAHQTARLKPHQRGDYIKWDLELEYEVNKLPKEDIVIFLHVPLKISLKLMEDEDRKKREYTKGKKKDLYESNVSYLRKSEKVYLSLVGKFSHWVKIECADKSGALKNREAIHEEVVKILKKRKLIRS